MTKCQLLDGFAIGIQFILAIIAFSSLLVKRQRELPKRPLLIWIMDSSKQAFGASFIHLLNIVFSIDAEVNPCGQYILNILLDTTIGVYILLFIHNQCYTLINRKYPLKSGYYGDSPLFKVWFIQFIVYLVALTSMKMIVVFLIKVGHLGNIVESLLFSMNEYVQIVVVMFIVPLIMNIVQFWLIDHGIKLMTTQAYTELVEEEIIEEDSEKDE